MSEQTYPQTVWKPIQQQSRQERIESLLTNSFGESDVAKANVLALLEIADAITELGAAIEKVGWKLPER